MPLRTREVDLYPNNLFERDHRESDTDCRWWAMYTLPRREKELMRKLRTRGIDFYGPTVAKRFRTPRGRRFTSYVPLFPNYVFIYGNELNRYQAVSQGNVSACLTVFDGKELERDLRQIWRLISSGASLTLESRLQSGCLVRVRAGVLRGVEGVILRREGQTRLLVFVNFLEQGASLLIEDCDVEMISRGTTVYPRRDPDCVSFTNKGQRAKQRY